jgi:hypothetical protein
VSVLGFDFIQGPEVPKPAPIDRTLAPTAVQQRRVDWMEAITAAIREHDAWGVLVQRPNMDVELYDVLRGGGPWEATAHGGRVWLLLAREAKS